MNRLVIPEGGAHWYYADGTPCYELPNLSHPGQVRAPTLRDAKILTLFPSTTGIIGIIRKPAVEAWQASQYILSALTLPRMPGEPADAFAQRVVKDGRVESAIAADFGSNVHKLAEQWLERTLPDYIDPYEYTFLQGIMEWTEIHHLEGIATEVSFTYVDEGYGGRLDFMGTVTKAAPLTCNCGCINWPDDVGIFVIGDWKTQKTYPGKPAVFYPEYPVQLRAYAHGVEEDNANTLSVVVSNTEPGRVECKMYSADPESDLYDQDSWAIFRAIKRVYYSPMGQGEDLAERYGQV